MSIKIIAEAGVNHNGSLELAKKLAETAKWAGADYVKYQTFRPQSLVSKAARKAEYQKKSTGDDEGQLAMLEKLCLSFSDFRELQACLLYTSFHRRRICKAIRGSDGRFLRHAGGCGLRCV